MSEEHTPPKPTTKTSAVPLKKETVRITLRPNAPGADAPPATVPLSPPPRPSFGAPPAPTVPLSPPPRPSIGGAPPSPSGAPSAPTAPGAPPRPAPPVAPVGSKTIPLGAAPPRPAAPGALRPAPAGPGAPAGGTQPLPPRTATIARPAAPTAAISSAPIRTTASHDEDLEVDDGPLNILSVVALVASIAAVFLVFATVDAWPMSYGFADSAARKGDWEKDNDVPGFKLPLDYSPFDKKVEGGTVTSNYEAVAPKLPAPPTLD